MFIDFCTSPFFGIGSCSFFVLFKSLDFVKELLLVHQLS